MNLLLQIDKLYALPVVKKVLPNEGQRTAAQQIETVTHEEN
jgi:hypothetical protein